MSFLQSPTFQNYVAPPIAATAAIIPVYRGFQIKSAQQLNVPVSKFSFRQAVIDGCKAAPTIGAVVGTQVVAQKLFQKTIQPYLSSLESMPWLPDALSSLGIGLISIPGLAIFNGYTRNRSALQSLKFLSLKQGGAILAREWSFLFSLNMIEPAKKLLLGQKRTSSFIDSLTAFACGFIGSAISHPADTALTLWQEGRKISQIKGLARGLPAKGVAVGLFCVVYNKIIEHLK